MANSDNITTFETMLMQCKRSGIERLIEYIRSSDFYTAPASTRFHSCHEGGLLEHSLNVAECMLNKFDNSTWSKQLHEVGRESIVLCALLHDICKTNFYGVEFRNKKVYSEHGTKSDSNGRYDWETVPSYTINDKVPYGHGEKSVMMIEQFIKLKPVERFMIRFHMGFSEPKELYNVLGTALRKYPVILALNEADLEATYLLEEEE